MILSIARLYGLRPDETNQLIEACGALRKRSAEKARYVPLSPDEVFDWDPLNGPMSPIMDVWQSQLRFSRDAYLVGELRTARRLAESVLWGIEACGEDVRGDDVWSGAERDEMSRLWIDAWHGFFESSALLETGETVEEVCKPYLARARLLAHGANNSRQIALALHLEGDYYHLQGWHARAMDLHLQAFQQLGSFDADPALAAMIQRLIILDGAHLLPREQLADHVRKGRDMTERLSPEDDSSRVLLCEAVGRALGMVGDPDCWKILAEAELDARRTFPVGYVTTLYSRMVALASTPHLADPDQMRFVGTYALIAATHNGWKRRMDQITQTAIASGVTLPALP